MIAVPAGTFTMGSDHDYPEERPAHEVQVDAFHIEETPVTVAQFAAFVDVTDWVTAAEREPAGFAVPAGSAVFTPPDHPVDLGDPSQWWSWVAGAQWRHPTGPSSTAEPDHPVVQVAFEDALAYCRWAGVTLPTEVQWEWAAQGSHRGEANVWEGAFPYAATGLATTSPVGTYPPNPSGLVDAVGNVWEWTLDLWSRDHTARPRDHVSPCCAPASEPPGTVLRVAKGGSFLCSEDYCARYRPEARMAMAVDAATCHLGFRVVLL